MTLPNSRKSLIGAIVVLGGIFLGGTYLVANLLENRPPQAGPAGGDQGDQAIDPEVLVRPGVAAIRKLGGRVVVDATKPDKPIVEVLLPSTEFTDEGLATVEQWTALRVLDLSGTKISDAGLDRLKNLKELESLYLAFTEVKGEGLKALSTLPRLVVLDLSKTQVTDAALTHLTKLSTLQVLSLIDTPIGDDGLKHLTSLTNLRRLDLAGTQITDAGLVRLQTLTALESLTLNNAPVTVAGSTALKSKLPRTEISMSE